MARRSSARRYAQAVFEIAVEKGELDRWQSDLKKIAATLQDAAFAALLEHPKLRLSDRTRLLSERLSGMSPLAMNLVYLLASRDNLGIAGGIAAEYQRLLDAHRGIEAAEVVTAVPLDEKDKVALAERLGKVIGKKVVITSRVDPELIGGLVARFGGKLLDGSTRGKLEALKKQVSGVAK